MGDNKKKEGKWLGSQLWGKLTRVPKDRLEESGSGVSILTVYHPPKKGVVAKVILNGYNIDHAVSLGDLGAMRSFKIVDGDLWDEWNEQTAVVLADANGQKTLIRVAALPSDDDSFGLIEFISPPK